jgi:opacity protein-like surface antigen
MRRATWLLILLLPAAAAAEIGQGTVEISGSGRLGFSDAVATSGGANRVETRTLGLQVGALQYLAPHLGLGAEVGLFKTFQNVGGVRSDVTSTSIAPKLGVAWPVGERSAVFGEALVGWREDQATGGNARGPTFGAGAGVKLFLANAFSVDFGLSYRHARLLPTGGGATLRTSNLFAGVGLSGYLFAR